MAELQARSAFQLSAAYSAPAAPVWVRAVECGFASIMVRRGAAEAVSRRALELYGIALQPGPRRAAAGPLAWIGTGPGAWLAVSQAGGPSAAQLREGLSGLASVVDQSGGYGLLQIGGPRAADLLASGVFLDLHPRAFPAGSAAGTVLAHVGVTLWRLGDDLFELAAPRSFAAAIAHWLETAGPEFGLGSAARP